ncbi:pseudouridine synthase [Lophiostoma macrostomum CBS 122681]|uniref:Pseudouridine synthase n=1 Tax=Lophiostoma macrostomum CBS 122681 TaxID=1314788 RepID=A0A6A6T782_9PLEO|nr:pseudouridine synthase [Lophiostoma macrostomum CBS 122681]
MPNGHPSRQSRVNLPRQKVPILTPTQQAMKLGPARVPLTLSDLAPICLPLSHTTRPFHNLSRVPRLELFKRQAMASRGALADSEYANWTPAQLIARIQDLESQLHTIPASPRTVSTSDPSAPNPETFTSFPIPNPAPENAKRSQAPEAWPPQAKNAPGDPVRVPKKKHFDPAKYSTRLIALKFAYLGQRYNGFEHHKGNKTPLPTVEEELWKAMIKTRLINPTPSHTSKASREKEEGQINGDFPRQSKSEVLRWDEEGAEVNWEGCEYSKCGRTDRGVSAFGQVIGVRVRSYRPLPNSKPPLPPQSARSPSAHVEDEVEALSLEDAGAEPMAGVEEHNHKREDMPFDDLRDELPYVQLLNRVLPPDIRIYAWCADLPPDFSARFSCKERRYKYFFTNPCFAPVPGDSALYTPSGSNSTPDSNQDETAQQVREGWLDIAAMRAGCASLIGLHDFRNMCKIDASKQLSNFNRRIFHASIDAVSPLSLPTFLSHPALQPPSLSPNSNPTPETQPQLYCLTLHGSAFLWHQVRSIIALLFLIGQRLEPASLIPSLLDIPSNPRRPKYEMASDAPLVLWDCIFPHPHEAQDSEVREHGYVDRLPWIHVGDPGAEELRVRSGAGAGTGAGASMGLGKWGRGGVVDDVWEVWRGRKVEETLSGMLLDVIANQGTTNLDSYIHAKADEGEGQKDRSNTPGMKNGPRVFGGADFGRAKGKYTPLLQRERQDTVEVVNARYARRKVARDEEKRGKGKQEDVDA